MSNSKKIILILKVFLPLLIKAVCNLYEQVTDAFSEQNIEINKKNGRIKFLCCI